MTERAVFFNALARTDPGERAAYLDSACAGDPALRARIEALLRSSANAGDFLDTPAVEQLAAFAGDRSTEKEHTISQDSSVIGVYANIDKADAAVQKLGQGGFPIQHVLVITQDLGGERKVHGFVTSCDVARASACTGAWVGWLTSLGISRQHILKYEDNLRAGKVLLVAHGSADENKKAQAILTATAPAELTAHVA